MTQRGATFFALSLASVAVLGAQLASYGFVYPAGHGLRWPLAATLLGGGALASAAALLSLRSFRRAAIESERFVALLALAVSLFFLFVVVVGFGLPHGWLGARD